MKRIREIAIIGGGSAGYMTALAMVNWVGRTKNIKVTVYESPDIPTIKVGEGTTGGLTAFLHNTCRIDRDDFVKKVRPVKKLVARFDFGPDHNPWWDYPLFGSFKMLNPAPYQPSFYAHKYGRHTAASFNSMLVNQGRTADTHDGEWIGHGYHFENQVFIKYLREQFEKIGSVVYKTVADATVNEDGVDEIIFTDNTKVKADLYIDCTGFKSFLLGQKMGAKFIDYSDRLPCDRAVLGFHPNKENPLTCTLIEKMNAGWIWTLDRDDERVRGYVHASRFISEEEAIKEYKERVDIIPEKIRVVNFKSGRRELAWIKNVVGIGNSFSFIEPMEATALHHTETMIRILMETIYLAPYVNEYSIKTFNSFANEMAVAIKDFIEAHYIIGHGPDTPFWNYMNGLELEGTAKRAADWYKYNGPAISAGLLEDQVFSSTDMFRWPGYLHMFMGCEYPTQWENPVTDMTPWYETLDGFNRACERHTRSKHDKER
jgi:tryptophan halogenase